MTSLSYDLHMLIKFWLFYAPHYIPPPNQPQLSFLYSSGNCSFQLSTYCQFQYLRQYQRDISKP